MSYFGKNIRKIRTLKKLSQGEFAKIFNLNRSNIGAYEEERSEAKIDTIIEIAHKFNISIDDLLTKELSIDDIYELNKGVKSGDKIIEKNALGEKIRVVQTHRLKFFPEFMNDQNFINHLPYIHVPFEPLEETQLIAFELSRQLASPQYGFHPEDIIITQEIDSLQERTKDFFALAVYSKKIMLGNIKSDNYFLSLNSGEKKISTENLDKIFIIKAIYKPEIPYELLMLDKRISKLEQNLKIE